MRSSGALGCKRSTIPRRQFYSIGNSLTYDYFPFSFSGLASASGAFASVGYHIRAASTLAFMQANPSDFTLVSPAQWNVALPVPSWNFLTAQPYYGSTIGGEMNAILAFIAATYWLAPTRIFVYEGWPEQNAYLGNYQSYWAQSVPNSLTQATQHGNMARQLFEHIQDRTASSTPGKVFIVPTGEVFNQLDIEARAGNIPGATTVSDFYRDNGHMGDTGRFVAASTVFATLYHRASTVNASALIPYVQGLGTLPLTLTLAQQLEPIVWSVVSSYARSGV